MEPKRVHHLKTSYFLLLSQMRMNVNSTHNSINNYPTEYYYHYHHQRQVGEGSYVSPSSPTVFSATIKSSTKGKGQNMNRPVGRDSQQDDVFRISSPTKKSQDAEGVTSSADTTAAAASHGQQQQQKQKHDQGYYHSQSQFHQPQHLASQEQAPDIKKLSGLGRGAGGVGRGRPSSVASSALKRSPSPDPSWTSPSSFPSKLRNMLEYVHEHDLTHIVSWKMDGKALKVYNPKDFERVVMPKFFTQTKMKSFQRQLISHGFHRIPGGNDKGCYIHKRFVRNVLASASAPATVAAASATATTTPATDTTTAHRKPKASATMKQSSPAAETAVTPTRSSSNSSSTITTTAAQHHPQQKQPQPSSTPSSRPQQRAEESDPFERLLDMVTDPADTSPASLSSSSGTPK